MTTPVATPTSVLPALSPETRAGAKPLFTIEALGDVPVRVEAPLGTVDTTLREILELVPGSIVMLDRLTGESIPLTTNGTAVAKGELRVHGERFAVRITEILGRVASARAGGVEPHAKPPSGP